MLSFLNWEDSVQAIGWLLEGWKQKWKSGINSENKGKPCNRLRKQTGSGTIRIEELREGVSISGGTITSRAEVMKEGPLLPAPGLWRMGRSRLRDTASKWKERVGGWGKGCSPPSNGHLWLSRNLTRNQVAKNPGKCSLRSREGRM